MNIAPNLAEIGLKYTDSMPTPFFFFFYSHITGRYMEGFLAKLVRFLKKEKERKSGQLLVFYPSKSGPWITHDMIEKQ